MARRRRRRASAARSSRARSCSPTSSRSAKQQGTSWIDAEDAFRLHDTYGFPYDLTRELLQGEGLAVDDAGFHELMEEQRERARTGAARATGSEDEHEQVREFVRGAGFTTRFVGYETTEVRDAASARCSAPTVCC